jgi:hypothetical protein
MHVPPLERLQGTNSDHRGISTNFKMDDQATLVERTIILQCIYNYRPHSSEIKAMREGIALIAYTSIINLRHQL